MSTSKNRIFEGVTFLSSSNNDKSCTYISSHEELKAYVLYYIAVQQGQLMPDYVFQITKSKFAFRESSVGPVSSLEHRKLLKKVRICIRRHLASAYSNQQVDFLQWKQDANLREIKVMRRFHIQSRYSLLAVRQLPRLDCVTLQGRLSVL